MKIQIHLLMLYKKLLLLYCSRKYNKKSVMLKNKYWGLLIAKILLSVFISKESNIDILYKKIIIIILSVLIVIRGISLFLNGKMKSEK